MNSMAHIVAIRGFYNSKCCLPDAVTLEPDVVTQEWFM